MGNQARREASEGSGEDLYDAGKFLAGLDWSAIGDKILHGGGGATVMGDGSKHTPGSGIGGGKVGGGDGESAAGFKRELAARDQAVLHPAAAAILEPLLGPRGSGKALSVEDRRLIARAVPEDLTPEEIAEVKARLGSPVAAGSGGDTVQQVIAAVQSVRPFGEKQVHGGAKSADAEAHRGAHAYKAAHDAKSHVRGRGGHDAKTSIVDPIPELRRHVSVDPTTGNPSVPAVIDFAGVRATSEDVRVARLVLDDAAYLVKVRLRIVSAPPGLSFADDHSAVLPRSTHQVVFELTELVATGR